MSNQSGQVAMEHNVLRLGCRFNDANPLLPAGAVNLVGT